MALRTIRIGSAIDIFQYDDGDFPTAIHTEGPIQSDTAPTNPNEVVRLVDVGAISGDVIGSGASTDKAIVRFDGVTGKLLQDSLVTINDTGSISLPIGETVDGIDISSLTPLIDDSMADALHRHSELSAADGTPNQAVFVDNAGNVGFRTILPQNPLQIGSVFAFQQDVNSGYLGVNFGDNVAGNYIKSQYATQLHFDSALGEINFRTAPSGTAGNAIAWDTRITILPSGNVGIAAIPTQLFSVNEKAGITSIGGFVIKLTNKTGVNTVAGQLVKSDTATDDGFIITAAGDTECFGVVYESGIADNEEAWIVVDGIADVAMEDNTAATHGNWVETSDVEAGYANATTASPPAAPAHFEEIGHCIESVVAGGAGTHILARCKPHFN